MLKKLLIILLAAFFIGGCSSPTPDTSTDSLPTATAVEPTSQPAAVPDPCSSGATAICVDGSKSFASGHRGACSRHGGVARWCR